ncbi:MAG: site-specific DNA-methyltransferase [Acidobacteria bacterium]|nr:site-specific DNA-methyltransferase [Acidobacteriota bacterium]MBI3656042.1 site-specific DNA-methyltransferase [Acidobacteriota bacterium]
MKKKRTKTSAFGAPGRISHDSSRFYKSRLYASQSVAPALPYAENPIDPTQLDKIYCKSSACMDDLPDSSVHLMVTSPPYNANKEYDEELSLDEYRDLLRTVFKETYRKLVTGGRACINIANLGRKPYVPLHSYIIKDMVDLGYLMRGEIIWNKAARAGSSTAWGSWRSASNPTLRDVHEYILIFSKQEFNRKRSSGRNTISRDEFLEFTKSVWTFTPESAKKIGHPAPFPLELPYRLIQLYTFKEDVVLDPFCGSGSACLAAIKTGRHYVGYDIKQEYVQLAEKRIKKFILSAQPSLFGATGASFLAAPRIVAPNGTLTLRPSLESLAAVSETALYDSLEIAMQKEMDAYIGYPKEAQTGFTVYRIAPHWIERHAYHEHVLWAYCEEMKREYCFLLAKISGIALIDAP